MIFQVEEETTFTSVSQIQPPEDEIKVPHPPEAMKEGKKRSPRKVAVPDRAAKRHIDGIRQHHEQRSVDWARGYKTSFIINLVKQEIYPVSKYQIPIILTFFLLNSNEREINLANEY